MLDGYKPYDIGDFLATQNFRFQIQENQVMSQCGVCAISVGSSGDNTNFMITGIKNTLKI